MAALFYTFYSPIARNSCNNSVFFALTDSINSQEERIMSCYGQSGFGSSPYPTADNVKCDKRMAKALFDSFAGEMSSINSYIYYSVIFSEANPDLAEAFGEIAMTEMIHFRLLAQCIRRLGANPALCMKISTSSVNECACNVYEEEKRAIERSICEETAAYEEYHRLAECTCDSALRAVLERLACDEADHRRTLERMI